jgi:hypothetical protein
MARDTRGRHSWARSPAAIGAGLGASIVAFAQAEKISALQDEIADLRARLAEFEGRGRQ